MNEKKSKNTPLKINPSVSDYDVLKKNKSLSGSTYWKFVGKFLLIIVVAIGALWGGFFVQQWQATKNVEKFAEGLETWQKEQYDLAMADTYGGKTPQETLQMYIDAVEKGDYELASKYFIAEKREKEIIRLDNAKKEKNLEKYLNYIKLAIPWRSLLEDKNFTMEAKIESGGSIFLRFIKYPNNTWKIIEI